MTSGREAGTLPNTPTIISADGKRAASDGGIVRVWDYPNGKAHRVAMRQYSNAAFEPISLSADGKLLALGAVHESSLDSYHFPTVIVWDTQAEKPIAEVTAEQNQYSGVRLSPDGKTLATFGRHYDPKRKYDARNPNGWPEQAVQLWNVADSNLLARFAVSGRMVVAVAFSPDSTLVAVSAADGLISLRDARTGAEKHQLFGQTYMGTCLAFSPDSKTLAAAAGNARVQRWNVADGKLVGFTDPPTGPPGQHGLMLKNLFYTGPDRAVAWGMRGAAAVVWEVPSGKQLSLAGGLTERVTSVAFSADGMQVLTAAADATLAKWNATTGEPLRTVFVRPAWGHVVRVDACVQLLPGGTRGVSENGGSSVYDLTARKELFRLPVRENARGNGHIVYVSPDGTNAVTRLYANRDEKADCYEVWNLVAPKKLGEVEAPPAEWTASGVTTDGRKLFLFRLRGSEDHLLTGYDVTTGKPLAAVKIPAASAAGRRAGR